MLNYTDNPQPTSTNFDTEHETFRQTIFIQVLEQIKKKYVCMVRFEGDPTFTLPMQRELLRQVFRLGVGCVYNFPLALKREFDNLGFNDMYRSFNLEEMLVPNLGVKVLGVSPYRYDENGRVSSGNGVTSFRHNTGIKTFYVDKTNSAFMNYEDTYYNGMYKWSIYAYIYSTAMTIAKKRMSLLDPKFVSNNNNNSYSNEAFKEMYDISKSFLDVSPSQNQSISGDTDSMDVDITKLLTGKITKLDMSNGETILDLMSFLDKNKDQWNYLFGVRCNSNKKAERNISNEFNSDEVHFGVMEQDLKDQVEMFIEEYKKVFGKTLTYKIKEDEIMKEFKEQQIQISGRGNADPKGGINE